MLSSRTFRFASLFAGLVMAFSMVAVDHAAVAAGDVVAVCVAVV